MDDEEYLGAIEWWHNNKAQASGMGEFDLVHLLDATDEDEITLPNGQKVSRRDLSAAGKKAKAGGARGMTERGFRKGTLETITEGKIPIECLYPVGANWFWIDPTLPMFDHSREGRKINLRGPNWSRNSCAVDAMLGLGLFLNWGRTVLDQVDEVRLGEMTRLEQAYRAALMKDWSTLSAKGKNAIRDHIAEAAYDADPAAFPRGKFIDVAELARYCLGGVPHLEATTVMAQICCDNTFSVRGRHGYSPAEHNHFFEVDASVGRRSVDFFKRYYYGYDVNQDDKRPDCTSTPCTHEYSLHRAMVDRPPPVFVELLCGWTEIAGKSKVKTEDGTIESVSITCSRIDKSVCVLQYEVVGLVVMPSYNHFVARALDKDDILEMDGAYVKKVKRWLTRGDIPRVIVWKLKDVTEA